jgi:hypothetical protein
LSEWISIEDRLPEEGEKVLILFKEICMHCSERSSFGNRALGYVNGDGEWELSEPFEKDYFPVNHKYMLHVTHWSVLLESLEMIEAMKCT